VSAVADDLVRVVAIGAVSSLGRGARAFAAGEPGEGPPVAIAPDAELARAGLARPWCARASAQGPGDTAMMLFRDAWQDTLAELDARWPGWRALRCGLAVGTSSGGMRSVEGLFDAYARGEEPPAARVGAATYFPHPELGIAVAPASLVLCACASSTTAIGLAKRWLESDACDLAIAGGYDAVSVFVAAGFEALKATARDGAPRPFRVGRDGMALGEGAAFFALTRRTDAPARAYVLGFGAGADGVHITAPDRAGAGLARAASSALAEARHPQIDLVSAHGTATPYNDAAEARALSRALGDRAERVVVHPFKAQIGHTLGAAGALESAACVDAMERGILPAAAGAGELDPDARVRLLERAESGRCDVALKLSAAFGGANAALVLSREPRAVEPRRRREAFVSRAVHVEVAPELDALAAATGHPADRLARADDLTRYALAAVAALVARHGSLAGAGVVVGHAFATAETNAAYWSRIRERGARAAEPRRFPYTSPNAVAGDCGIAFGLTGPSFAVGFGTHGALEALVVAADLVRAGDADRVVVVGVDEVGDVVRRMAASAGLDARSGAVAALVASAPTPGGARVGATRLTRELSPAELHVCGHRALLPLLDLAPGTLRGGSPWGGFASIELLAL
jgi:3-oxoacyl-[acyl-carrier-protein] synthase-1/3-oxoacyl-[acyl-carrier-protein] synthase II